MPSNLGHGRSSPHVLSQERERKKESLSQSLGPSSLPSPPIREVIASPLSSSSPPLPAHDPLTHISRPLCSSPFPSSPYDDDVDEAAMCRMHAPPPTDRPTHLQSPLALDRPHAHTPQRTTYLYAALIRVRNVHTSSLEIPKLSF